jgi:DNA-binding MarR family transcriptional regulator
MRPTSVDAYAVAHRLHEASEESRLAFTDIGSDLGLTAPQARLVLRLFEPTAMGDLAAHLGCDKSNVTGLAIRLTERGLIAATRGPDRRVKLLELTPAGQQLRAELQQQVVDRSPAVTRLSETERKTLLRLLDKISAHGAAPVASVGLRVPSTAAIGANDPRPKRSSSR